MNTSENIIFFLTGNGPRSVKEMAESLNLTKADIRYHLKLLMHSKKIKKIEVKVNSIGRGRPAVKYEIVNEILQENLTEILKVFSNYLLSSKSLAQIADEIWLLELQSFSLSASPINRINDVLQFLNRLGVRAVWIAGKYGPQVKIVDNPYAKENPQPFYSVVDSIIQKAVNYIVKS